MPALRMKMTLGVRQSGLPAGSPESIKFTDAAGCDSEERPSRRSILKHIILVH